jgi:surface polysaccharide O-acyltransferase-like enzyme
VYQEQLKRLISDRIMKLGATVCLILFVGLTQLFHPVTQSILLLLFAIIKGIVGSLVIFYVFLKSKENVIKFKLAWIGTYTLEIYTVHFHFATKLNKGTLSFGLYSLEGFLFVVASFLLMSIMSAGLIYMIKQTRWTNLLLFGRK